MHQAAALCRCDTNATTASSLHHERRGLAPLLASQRQRGAGTAIVAARLVQERALELHLQEDAGGWREDTNDRRSCVRSERRAACLGIGFHRVRDACASCAQHRGRGTRPPSACL